MLKFNSIAGIALEGGKSGDKIKISYRYNCKDNATELFKFIIPRNDLDELVYPQILKYVEEGKISENFRLQRAHIIMYSNESKNKILLNGRTRFRVYIKLEGGVDVKDTLRENQINDVIGIYPNKQTDLNAAHIMLFKFKGVWLVSYDFTYNIAKALSHIEIARKLILEAETELEKGELKLIGKLLTAYKIVVLAILVQNNTKLSFKTGIRTADELFRAYAKNGNIDNRYSEEFTKLIKLQETVQNKSLEYSIDESASFHYLGMTRKLLQETEEKLRAIVTYRRGPGGIYIEK